MTDIVSGGETYRDRERVRYSKFDMWREIDPDLPQIKRMHTLTDRD